MADEQFDRSPTLRALARALTTNDTLDDLWKYRMTRNCTTCLPALLVAVIVIVSTSQWTAAEDNHPPAGFTALFNGKDLTGWKGLPKGPLDNPAKRSAASSDELAAAQKEADEDMRAHWSVVDGVITFDGKGRSLCTAKDYGDFEMLVDWKVLKHGDSGVYLRGTPQVQIWDPAVEVAKGVGSGGLYNNQKNPSKATKVADKPVGEWNSFRIKMVGDKVSVWLNDVLVTDNVVLENFWERDKPIYSTGQIELQNHGDPLYFKNIYIRELK